MPQVRQDTNKMIDYTDMVVTMDRPWKLLTGLTGLSIGEGKETTAVEVEYSHTKIAPIVARKRGGERNNMTKDQTATTWFNIPFFPLDASLTPSDIQNLRKAGTANDLENADNVLIKTFKKLRLQHAALLEKAIADALFLGKTYTGSTAAVPEDFYAKLDKVKKVVDFKFSDVATNVLNPMEEARSHVIDNIGDDAGEYEMVCVASPQWFSKFIEMPKVREAFQGYETKGQNPLKDRLGGNANSRWFEFGGVLFIEYRGAFSGESLVPANKAYMFPRGETLENLHLYYAPADTVADANTTGKELYVFQFDSLRSIDIESETSLVVINRKPQAVVECSMS